MPTFKVPDDDFDMDLFPSEQDSSGMEVDGDSFEAEIDGKTRVQSDPNWQAQQAVDMQYQNNYAAQQQAEADSEAQLARSPNNHQHNFRPAQLTRSRGTHNNLFQDQPMLYTDLPSSIGKRKRSDSQPPTRDTYHSDPDTTTDHPLRHIGGMMVTLYTTAFTLLASIYTYFRGQTHPTTSEDAQDHEILAIETDGSGRKRRAIPSGSFESSSESPKSQGSNSPTSPAGKATATATDPPGAFPSPGLPSPERSQSPKEPSKEFSKTSPQKDLDQMPNLDEYRSVVDSIEPTIQEMRDRFGNVPMGYDDWELLTAEKREQRRIRDEHEYHQWAMRQDAKKTDEEYEFLEKEKMSEETDRMDARCAANQVKFGEGMSDRDMRVLNFHHAIYHGEGKCEHDDGFQKLHEACGVEAHNVAKVIEAEVTNEHKDRKQTNPEESRAFRKTTAFSKFTTTKKGRSITGRTIEQGKHPKSVAATQNGDPAGASKEVAGDTKEELSRPTTASSHKPASYKGGLQPSPEKNGPGVNHLRPWSYDKTMAPGPSALKSKSKPDPKDKEIDALINRSKNITILSPQEKKVKDYMAKKREERKEKWNDFRDGNQTKKEVFQKERGEGKTVAKQTIAEAEVAWEKARLVKEAQKKAEEEEAARQAAEELAKLKVIEDERVRQEAEEAAKLKAEEEEAQARQAEEEEKAAVAAQDRLAAAADADATHARKQILIRPLDPEWVQRVQKAMDIGNKDTVLANGLDGTELSRHDFGSLLPQEGTGDDSSGWLNDNIVNAFIAAIVARKQEQTGYKRGANSVPAFEAYNSGWYTTCKKGEDLKKLDRWGKRKGIMGVKLLKCEKLFLPINTGGHWQLLIISPVERKIELLDSLNWKAGAKFKLARDWLRMELGEGVYKAEEWTEIKGRSSSQTNTDDCGVFVAMNALVAAKGYDFSDVSAAKMQEARRMVAGILLNGGLTGDWEL